MDGQDGPPGPPGDSAGAGFALVSTNTAEANGWHVTTEQVGTPTAYQLVVHAQCLANGAVTQVSAQSAVDAEAKDVTAACPAGATPTGGGYTLDD
jgi:hypothetical protein